MVANTNKMVALKYLPESKCSNLLRNILTNIYKIKTKQGIID